MTQLKFRKRISVLLGGVTGLNKLPGLSEGKTVRMLRVTAQCISVTVEDTDGQSNNKIRLWQTALLNSVATSSTLRIRNDKA